MPFGNSVIHRLGAIRSEHPTPQAGKTSVGGLSVACAGPQLRGGIAPLRHPARISAPLGRLRLSPARPAPRVFFANGPEPEAAGRISERHYWT